MERGDVTRRLLPRAERCARNCRPAIPVAHGMSTELAVVVFMVLWFVLNRWVLPRFGVNT